MKIMITGGHFAPAIAVTEEIIKYDKDIKIVFIGRKYAFDSEKTLSLEFREITKKRLEFINLPAGRMNRIADFKSMLSFLRIPVGFILAFIALLKQKPDKIISFGGYLALPVVFSGYLMRIPVYTHEQTVNPGLANRLGAFFSKKIFLSFPDEKNIFPPGKTVLVGNPLRSEIFRVSGKPFRVKPGRKVIFVTGGSLGSHSINLHIKKILSGLLKDFTVIHQTGDSKEYHDFEDLQELKKNLPEKSGENYFLRKHFSLDEIGYVYSVADLLIGRSGANTFFELIALELPSILIPLPWSAGKEQQKHAELIVRNGCGEIFHQIKTSNKLLRMIRGVIPNLNLYKTNFKKFQSLYKKNAARSIVSEVFREN